MEKTIYINQRIPLRTIDLALRAVMNGEYSYGFALELAQGDFGGANRQKKAATIIGKLTERNPLLPFLKEHHAETMQALAYDHDRALIIAALINAAFQFGYDSTWLLGKYFHVQDEVSYNLISNKLAEQYGSNRRLYVGLGAILPMYTEAGFIIHPRNGYYAKKALELKTQLSVEYYKQSFFLNNPLKNPSEDWFDHPYFEFLQ